MPLDAAITSAIIGSVTSLGMTASTQLQQGLSSSSGTRMGLIVENDSKKTYSVYTFKPIHGHWVQPPPNNLAGVGSTYDVFMDAVKSEYGAKATPAQINTLLTTWKETKVFDAHLTEALFSCHGVGDNHGFECLLQLVCIEDMIQLKYQAIYILIRKIPGGDFGVGLACGTLPLPATMIVSMKPSTVGHDGKETRNALMRAGKIGGFSESELASLKPSAWDKAYTPMMAKYPQVWHRGLQLRWAGMAIDFTDGGSTDIKKGGIRLECTAPGEQVTVRIVDV